MDVERHVRLLCVSEILSKEKKGLFTFRFSQVINLDFEILLEVMAYSNYAKQIEIDFKKLYHS